VAFKAANKFYLISEMASWAQFGLQDAVSPVIEEFIFFHDFTLIVLVFIIRFVFYLTGRLFVNGWVNRNLLEGQILERIWTVIPAIILLQIAVPSLLLLYILDETVSCRLTLKAIGHQWYWRYEYSDFWTPAQSKRIEFDSYIVPTNELEPGIARLLDVDNRVVLPFSTHTRVLIRAADVLHSWTVPALGVKADACPGRLNQIKFISHRPGVFYGQCSEICGANHRFIPIVVELVRSEDFLSWVRSLE
jgi:cytochrome c oxidase subunit 2